MKKLFLLFTIMSFCVPFALSLDTKDIKKWEKERLETEKERTKPVWEAILTSDVDNVQKNLSSVSKKKLTDMLVYAIDICDTNRKKQYYEKVDAVCDTGKNAQIIGLLLDEGANPNRIFLLTRGVPPAYMFSTDVEILKETNPAALPVFLSKMDKCLAAMVQIQGADMTKKNYFAYVDFWRNNNCKFSAFEIKGNLFGENKEEEKYSLELGTSKEYIEKTYGKPHIYEHPSQDREVLTYKKVETTENEYTVSGMSGKGKSIWTSEHHYIYTIDRGVVTKLENKSYSTTLAGSETEIIDQEKLKEKQEERKKAAARGVMRPR